MLIRIATECTSDDPEARPPLSDVIDGLDSLYRVLTGAERVPYTEDDEFTDEDQGDALEDAEPDEGCDAVVPMDTDSVGPDSVGAAAATVPAVATPTSAVAVAPMTADALVPAAPQEPTREEATMPTPTPVEAAAGTPTEATTPMAPVMLRRAVTVRPVRPQSEMPPRVPNLSPSPGSTASLVNSEAATPVPDVQNIVPLSRHRTTRSVGSVEIEVTPKTRWFG